MRHPVLSAVLSLSLLFVACADEGDADAGGEGSGRFGTISGAVLLGPTCPVEMESSPCPDEPAVGVEVQAIRDGSVSATTVTAQDGTFAMEVAAGNYVVQAVAAPEGPGMFAKPTPVTVTAGAVSDVTVILDTGIRVPEA